MYHLLITKLKKKKISYFIYLLFFIWFLTLKNPDFWINLYVWQYWLLYYKEQEEKDGEQDEKLWGTRREEEAAEGAV